MTVTLVHPDEIVADLRRREFLGILAAAGLLAGCGGPDESRSTRETRRVTDDLGRTVDVPLDPKRIALIDPLYTAAQLVDLGIQPLAMSVNASTPVELMPEALGAAVREAEPLGAIGSVDVEAVAAQRPDLILFNVPYQEDLDVEQLQRVAPTVAFKVLEVGDEANLRRLAGWVGRQQQAEQVIADWEKTLAGLAVELDLGGRRFSLVLSYPDGSAFNVDGPGSSLGKLVIALGGRVVPTEIEGEPIGDGAYGVSLEVLPDIIEADTILLQRYNAAESDDAIEDLLGSDLWQSIDAVQRGDVIVLDVQATASYGYAGLESVARQIAADL